MEKIPTIFERNMTSGGQIRDEYAVALTWLSDFGTVATEKVDGTNVRLTVRNHTLVRLEKRRNPDKEQKAAGIIEPWYVDSSETERADNWIWDAADNTDLADVADGEWSGEACGPKIQGNPLALPRHTVMLFSLNRAPVFDAVPVTFDGLREWFATKPASKFGTGPIEGIVWRDKRGRMAKIKAKDFR